MSDGFSPDFGVLEQAAPTWNAKRPVRILILGDFGAGAGAGRLETGAALAKRKPLQVEFDTIEDAMQRLRPSLMLPIGADGVPVSLELTDLDAFHPDTIYASVPLFAELASLRRRLNQPAQFAAAAADVMRWAEHAGPRASWLARQAVARGGAPSRRATLDDFARLTGRPSAAAKAGDEIKGLLRRVVGPFVQPASAPNKDALVGAVDAGLSDAMRAVLHHPDFQTTESLWRGVDFLLHRVETSHHLQVHLLDVSAEEFVADLSRADDLADTGLYRLLVEAPAQEGDGGYTYVAGCYQFDATPPHAEVLGRSARIAAHAGASLLVGINTIPFTNRKEPPHRLVQEAFAALRELPEASFLGLCGPRFLLRHPYGRRSDPISAFDFDEFTREAGLGGMLWGHPALLALVLLSRTGPSLVVDDLPFHHYVDEDGDSVALPCTDRLINTQAASMLREAGINAAMAHKGEAQVRFNGLEAVNGDGLAVAGATPKKATADARFALQSKIDARGAKAAAVMGLALRQGGARPVEQDEDVDAPAEDGDDEGADAEANADAEADAAADTLAEGSADGLDASDIEAPTQPAKAPDDELSSLLASLDEPSASSGNEPSGEAPMDPDLADLLKSLG